ncbi:1d228034-a253-43a8-81c7-c8c7df34e203 [Sclerotinia trifoliorum]|uniref:1d228034-a253-43a8-81c7-c8c7df34e203 n=1 Tax=Sclerotinia trifoliorum TaxID=28548 RepID=A0A8H2W6Z1_9HELO|nr:1d228034-a253-43a8-81c7-c8c7df34e203 [Sclerotinia trifoliorum]
MALSTSSIISILHLSSPQLHCLLQFSLSISSLLNIYTHHAQIPCDNITMSSQTSNIAVQGSVTSGHNYTSTSTPRTSIIEQSRLSANRIQTYLNHPHHSTTYASSTQTHNDQASVTQHYTTAAAKSIQEFENAFNPKTRGH